MNYLQLSDIASSTYNAVYLNANALNAHSVLSALNKKLDVVLSDLGEAYGEGTSANVISDDLQFFGDVRFAGRDLNIIGGNYVQTTNVNGIGVYNFSGANSFLQAEEAKSGSGASYGIACTGSRGYPILSVDAANRRLKLSGDVSMLADNITSSVKLAWSYALASAAGTSCMTVSNVSQESLTAGWACLDMMPSTLASLSTMSEEECIDDWTNDDNAFYSPIDPTIGNVNIRNFYGNHAEGGSTKAIGKYAHAEGRACTADNRYAHAEGSQNFAGGMASHAEGMNTAAVGRMSHAAGVYAYALDDNSYVWSSGAKKQSSHGFGTYTVSPTAGIDGFYIGDVSLGSLLSGETTVISIKSASKVDVIFPNKVTTYTSLKKALVAAPFIQRIKLEADVTLDFTDTSNQSLVINTSRILDLNGHMLSVICSNDTLATSGTSMFNVTSNANLVMHNGSVCATKAQLFKISAGSIQLKDITIETDNLLLYMGASAYNAQLEFIADVGSKVTSHFSEVRYPDKYNNFSIWVSRTNSISSDPTWKDYASIEEYRDAHPQYFPHLVFKGEYIVEGPECIPSEQGTTIVYQNGGSNMMGMIIDIEDGAMLRCPNGVALYSGNNNLITLNGGTITGFTGIGFRAGKLIVPEKSNVRVCGTGYADPPVKYVNAGWATCCSNGSALLVLAQSGYGSNRPYDTSKNTQELDIMSGSFISLKTEPVASVSMWKSATYAEGNVHTRVTKFVSGGYLSRFPDSDAYDDKTGAHASYDIIADDCYEQMPCQIVRSVK